MRFSAYSGEICIYNTDALRTSQKKGPFMFMKKALAVLLCTAILLAFGTTLASALEPYGNNLLIRDWVRNDPNYEFSDAYKTSVWFENFSALKLSDNERNNVLRIAISQLGYHEGNSAADFDGMNQNGNSNYIEYARLIVPNYNDNHYEWCACFVNWCLNQARIDHCYGEISCWKWVQWLKNNVMFQDSPAYGGTYTPLPADMIFFNWDGKNTGSGHIGLVLYATDTTVYTIEGNTSSGAVAIKSYALNDPCVIGYGTPEYAEGTEETMDLSYTNGRPRGTYIVNSSTTRLTTEAGGGDRICKVPLGSSVIVSGYEDGYALADYDGQTGYLPVSALVLLEAMQGVDTVTYDANGGENAPDKQEIPMGDEGTLTDRYPTLEGDTFLGWALRPYDVKPVYQPEDKVRLEGDVTLYAIWEKRSLTLAAAAMEDGILVEFPRPDKTENGSALILGAVDPALLSPANGTKVTIAEDQAYGKVLSFVTTGACADPYVTLPYLQIVRDAELAPTQAEDVKYVVLLVNNLSLANKAFDLFYTCADEETSSDNDQTARVVSATLAKEAGWQYVVFDMTDAKGWQGDIQSLRLDYERAALEAEETLLVADLYLISDGRELAALTEDEIYFFPVGEKVVYTPDTEAGTNPPDETTDGEQTPDGSSGEQNTNAPESGSSAATQGSSDGKDTDDGKSSCSSVMGASALCLVLPAAVLLVKRKKEDD